MLNGVLSRVVPFFLSIVAALTGTSMMALAQEARWALVQTVEIEAGATTRTVTFADDLPRSRALRLTPRQGAVTLSRLTITYGNGQQHIEDRRIALDEADGRSTRDIHRTTEGLALTTAVMTFAPPPAKRAVIEIWSLQVPPPPPEPRRASDISDVGKPRFHEVLVHFATNRKQLDDRVIKKGNREIKLAAFGGDVADAVTWGEAVITIPTTRDKGTIPRPVKEFYVFSFQYRREDPAKDFTLAAVDVTDAEKFSASMARVAGQAQAFAGHALVFVHGYNVTFDDALFRLAQLSHDMQFDGPVAAYSWPSRGATLDYRHDLDAVRVSRRGLLEVLERVAAVPGVKQVNIIAHSMGSDPTLETLARLRDIVAAGGRVPELKLNEVVFAAPDVTRQLFAETAARLTGAIAKGVTLYASASDTVLQLSKKVSSGFVRAGDAPDGGPPLVAGVDSIDITKVSTSSFATNHSEFGDRAPLIEDLKRLFAQRVSPRERGFAEIGAAPRQFWRFEKK